MSFSKSLKSFLRVVLQVDVIVALGGFSALLLEPLKNEYIYAEIAGSRNTSRSHGPSCNKNSSNAATELIDQEVSRLTLLLDLAMFIPASLTGIFVTSWSDRVGRKVAMVIPLVGMMLSSAFFSVSIHFKLTWGSTTVYFTALHHRWPLSSLYLYYLVAGMGGYYMTLLIQGNAYLSDITDKDKRGIRFVILETSLGIGGGLAGVVSGYWVDAKGFFNPVASTIFINLLALLLVPLLPDSNKIREERKKQELLAKEFEEYPEVFDDCSCNNQLDKKRARTSSSVTPGSKYGSTSDGSEDQITTVKKRKYTFLDLLRSVWRVYTTEYSHCEKCHGPIDENHNGRPSGERCIHGGGLYTGRVWRMWFYLISYDSLMFVVVGTMVFQTVYYLSEPLCFSSVLVGAQLGVRYAGVALGPFIVMFYHRCLDLSNTTIIIIGLIAEITSCIVMSFATKEYIVFIATAVLLFANSAKPFIQAQVSSLVSETEQGSAYALQSCTEILTYLIATVTFFLLFPATVGIYHGFVWLFAAALMFIPLCLISYIHIQDRRTLHSLRDESKPLLS